ncbi:MAG TPA: DUF4139 domain-containing protein [Saprospiraceae bacterium]|nr:DUF4139 domain-containing protein [Saprospiraceae bacterium]
MQLQSLIVRFCLASVLLFQGFLALATDHRLSPQVQEVTVYRSGAKVSSVGSVKVSSGKSKVIFENLSPWFDPNSLQVRIKGSASLLSAVFQIKTPAPIPENPRAPVLRDSLLWLSDDMVRIRDERDVLDAEKVLIDRKMDQVGTGSDGPNHHISLTVAELRELSAFYRQRLGEIRERLLQLTIRERKLNELYLKLQQELQRIQPNASNNTGEIVLQIETDAPQQLEIICNYLVSQAGWTPLYDLRSEGMEKPLRLLYKAKVFNGSGFDWKGVRMKLSTANPLANNDRPILTPIYVNYRIYAAIPESNVEKDALYNMMQVPSAPIARDLERSTGSADDGEIVEIFAPDNTDELMANFDVKKPQDVLSDGQENIVELEEMDIPAAYEYHAVPKLDPAIYLLAKITDYGRYNLLPGIANVFYQDTYIGQTSINPQTVADTMLLSLGRDEQITIKRVQPKELTERKKIFSNTVKETYTYEIVVKNNKSLPVRVEILDQIPVSRQKDIVVELEDKDGAEYQEEFGKLKWELEVPANQNKRIRFTYTVKYPKGMQVSLGK